MNFVDILHVLSQSDTSLTISEIAEKLGVKQLEVGLCIDEFLKSGYKSLMYEDGKLSFERKEDEL